MAGKKQIEMKFRTWGGKRRGAGRKRRIPGPKRVPHRVRPKLASRFPVHVTTRIRDDMPRLRNRKRCKVIREAMMKVLDEPGFRICEFSVQKDHLHLICEAKSHKALARGIQRFKQRVARGINRQIGRKRGSVFYDRYHFEILKSPRQTRNAIAYVLQNARKHNEHVPAGRADPYSSALWFDGWSDASWRQGLAPPPGGPCVSKARTWMLRVAWRRHRLLCLDEVPGGRRPRA